MTAREALEVALYSNCCEDCKHHGNILDPKCRDCIHENPRNILNNWQGTVEFLDSVIERIKTADKSENSTKAIIDIHEIESSENDKA